MTFGARRRIIPTAVNNLDLWQAPDQQVLQGAVLNNYELRRQAVTMYANGLKYSEIRTSTGLGEDEVRRLVKRCVTPFGNGDIYGFRALVKGIRIKDYVRTSSVIHHKGGDSGGCAGALEQLFDKFPEVREKVHQLYFDERGRGNFPEACMPITVIHHHFKKQLRTIGFTEYDWPFNTENTGYQALWSYLKRLRLENELPLKFSLPKVT